VGGFVLLVVALRQSTLAAELSTGRNQVCSSASYRDLVSRASSDPEERFSFLSSWSVARLRCQSRLCWLDLYTKRTGDFFLASA